VSRRAPNRWSFDRASSYYDSTRGLPAATAAAVQRLLVRELQDRGLCLEVGVGTGRIALPLADAGVAMAGVDLSHTMLAKLVEKSGGSPPFPLAMADVALLPFRSGRFGAALACHVLHLVEEWRTALAELARVVRRPGVVLIDIGGWGQEWTGELVDRFIEASVADVHVPGTHDLAQVDAAMRDLGARPRRLERVVDERREAPADLIQRLEAGLFSITWQMDEIARRRGADAVRAWAERRWGAPDRPQAVTNSIIWTAYDLE
jgi:ubiquinone/menaquinone biosynthesis C-methylase UbiE